MKIGYARVSSKEQNLDRQLKSLTDAGCEKIYCDKMSGKDFNRPEYQKMIEELKEDDVVYLHSLDRLGRNYDMIIEEWRKITRKANIVVIDNEMNSNKDDIDIYVKDINSFTFVEERQEILFEIKNYQMIRLYIIRYKEIDII